MRQTVTLPGSTLAAAGAFATYRVPAPTNGVRVCGLVSVRVRLVTDGTGAANAGVEIADRAGNTLMSIPGNSTAQGAATDRVYSWGRVLGVVSASATGVVCAGIPCKCELEDGDLISVTGLNVAANVTATEIVITLETEAV